MKVPDPFYVFFALDAADRFQNPLYVSFPEMLLTQVPNPMFSLSQMYVANAVSKILYVFLALDTHG